MKLGRRKKKQIGLGSKYKTTKQIGIGTKVVGLGTNQNKIDGTWKKIQNKTSTWNNNKIDRTWSKTKQNRQKFDIKIK